MKEMGLISEVSNLSREIRSLHRDGITRPSPGVGRLQQWNVSLTNIDDDATGSTIGAQYFDLHATTKLQLSHLLGEWEEPDIPPSARKNATPWNDAQGSVNDVLQFRQAVSLLDTPCPFSLAFGKSTTREQCVKSAQSVYERLMLQTPGEDMLPFETMSLVALDQNDSIDDAKMKRLIRLFRPDRSGKLSKLDFVKSVDSVYKKFRMLRASIYNSGQIDEAFERLINSLYYFLLAMLLLSIMDLNPWPFIASLTGVLVSFAFCFGSAASHYFEGLLLIFVRRPYDIGDKIGISPVDNVSNPDGSSAWFVEGVSLFTTTARYATTNEIATFSNGSLANSRIINAFRSPKAQVHIYFKFSLEVSHEKITLFRDSLESFVKARPREWIALSAFRTKSVEADLGYVEYSVVLIHREKWQSLPAILDSKADIQSFAVEVSQRLGIRYVAPPMGVMLDTAPALSASAQEDAAQGATAGTDDSSEREALLGLARDFLRKESPR